MKGTLVALRLINPDNLCFVHATILAFFWGFIHLRHAKWNDLGGAARLLMDLCSRSSLWVDVRDIDCWHHCAAVLNFAIAKNFHEQELRHHGTIYGTARQADGLTAGLEEAAPDTLSAWLGMDTN